MGSETSKCFDKRLRSGHFERYLVGQGLDVGCGTDRLVAPRARVDGWDLSDGDAQKLEGVANETYDFVYSSHCLEHLRSIEEALANWIRVLKPGGYLYVVIPDYSLYEKEEFPSHFNGDHKHTFSIHLPRQKVGRANHWNLRGDMEPLLGSLGADLLETALEDDNYDYALDNSVDQTHFPDRLAQVCMIARKRGGQAEKGPISAQSGALRIYTGILGQIGDIVMFTPTVRRLKVLFPEASITFAISRKFDGMAPLLTGLPYVDRVFLTDFYFDKLTPQVARAWQMGWPVDLRGDDEVAEQRRHEIVLETRPRSRRWPWWRHAHQVEECANMVGVPGPIDLQTEIAIPRDVEVPSEVAGKIIIHNDPSIDSTKAWPWASVRRLAELIGPEHIVLIGSPGPQVTGITDLRGKTTLAQAAAAIRSCRCYVGIDSGPMWIAGSLQAPTVGLYGTSYIPAYGAIQPRNPNATYLQVEGRPENIPPEEVFQSVRARLDSASR